MLDVTYLLCIHDSASGSCKKVNNVRGKMLQ